MWVVHSLWTEIAVELDLFLAVNVCKFKLKKLALIVSLKLSVAVVAGIDIVTDGSCAFPLNKFSNF